MISPKEYDKIVKKNSPKSTIFKNCLMAFLIGGAICTVGQGLLELYQMWGLDEDTSKTLTSVTLIFFGILLTAIGVYDKIAKHAGAGTLVPITGFANAVSSPSCIRRIRSCSFISLSSQRKSRAMPFATRRTSSSVFICTICCL